MHYTPLHVVKLNKGLYMWLYKKGSIFTFVGQSNQSGSWTWLVLAAKGEMQSSSSKQRNGLKF